MTTLKTSLNLFMLCLVIIISCNPKKSDSGTTGNVDSLTFEALDPMFIYGLNEYLSPSFTDPEDSLGVKWARGKVWRLWEKLHKSCQKSELTKEILYFGPSNTLGLGTIIRIDKESKSIIADFPLLKDSLTGHQEKLIYNIGSPAECKFAKETKINIEFLAKSNLNSAIDTNLESQIDNSKSIKAKIDNWKVNNLYTGGLASVLQDTTKKYFRNYLDRLNKNDNYVITKEILITGFSATIKTKTKISTDLKAQLEEGIIENLGDIEAKVKFSYAGETTIKMTTIRSFKVFCEVKSAKLITE